MITELLKLQNNFWLQGMFEQANVLTHILVKIAAGVKDVHLVGTWEPMSAKPEDIRNDIYFLEELVRKRFQASGTLQDFLSPINKPTKTTAYAGLDLEIPSEFKAKYDNSKPIISLMCLQALMNVIDDVIVELYDSGIKKTLQLKDSLFKSTGVDLDRMIITRRLKLIYELSQEPDIDVESIIKGMAEENPELTVLEIKALFREKYPQYEIPLPDSKIQKMIVDIKKKRRFKIFDDMEKLLQPKREWVSDRLLSRQDAIISTANELKNLGYRIEYSTLRNLLNSNLQIEPNKFAGPKWHTAYKEWKGIE